VREFAGLLAHYRAGAILGSDMTLWGHDPTGNCYVAGVRHIFTEFGVPWVDGTAIFRAAGGNATGLPHER